jgi:hypothetical protein
MMRLLKEITYMNLVDIDAVPNVKCKLFGDNSGAVELAKVPNMRPRTNHIAMKYWLIKVFQVSTNEQLTGIFTKNLGVDLSQGFRRQFCGW